MLTPRGVPRKLPSMAHRTCPQWAPRWLLAIVVSLLMLGHVCELPAFAALVIPQHSTEGRSGDGHEHEGEIACEPVDAAQNTTPVQLIGTVQALPASAPISSPLITPSSIERTTRRPSRQPLFVLHASLLI